MKKSFIPLAAIVLCSCILYGSGTKIVSGTLNGTVPSTAKIGLFSADDDNTFLYGSTEGTEKDVIYINTSGDTTGLFTPVLYVSPDGDDTYSITFPDDPSTVKCLVAWDDLNDDDIFDLDTESAYLPVKTIDSINYVVHHFSYIELTEVITYYAVYSNIDSTATDYGTLYNDNFDAIGADNFDFNFD